ncbi:MAG TPA: radical SAM protein [Nostocaceae cyanobacterium]|nr:radical SAM protein [Nostocaceae cyanobacterium]
MDLLLVSIPMDLGKKPYDLAFPFLKRLNFGILAIASYMTERGFHVGIFDPQAHPEEDCLIKLLQNIKQNSPNVIGLSCISGFSYPSCLKIASVIRQNFPSITIFVGGKDHVGQIAESVLLECLAIDIVVRGEGEEVLCQLIEHINQKKPLDDINNIVYRHLNGEICSTHYDLAFNPQKLPRLNYSLYPNFQTFAPSLEVGRGCTFSCEFCVSAKTGVRKKDISSIINEAENITFIYGDNEICIYLETPMFLMLDEEILELAIKRQERNLKFTWRTSTRIEYLTPERLNKLAKAGCRVLDVGLESADFEILLRMGKTRNPQKYLERASEILSVAYNLGIIIKLNILFYIGESLETIATTLSFIEQNLPYVVSVSAYPLLLYPGSSLEEGIGVEIKQYGGTIVTDGIWQSRHLWPVNPSAGLTYDFLQELGILFTKSFQTMETFYKQKRYGYFSPQISYPEFVDAATNFGLDSLPFSRNLQENVSNRKKLWNYLKN